MKNQRLRQYGMQRKAPMVFRWRKALILVLMLTVSNPLVLAQSLDNKTHVLTQKNTRPSKYCGHYQKNGRTHYISCSLGNTATSQSKTVHCQATLSIHGKTHHFTRPCRHQSFSQTTKAQEPTGQLQKRQQSLKALINQLAIQHQLSPALIHAIITVESGYQSQVISHKGAMGLMQLMPATASELGIDNPLDPAANLNGGIRYFKQQLQTFNQNIDLALAAYNAGAGAVKRYQNRIPPFAETQHYVQLVKAYHAKYQQDWQHHIH